MDNRRLTQLSKKLGSSGLFAFRALVSGTIQPAQLCSCRPDACSKDATQCTTFLSYPQRNLPIPHLLSQDNVQPDLRFVEFFERYAQFVDKITGTFRTAGFGIVRCRGCRREL